MTLYYNCVLVQKLLEKKDWYPTSNGGETTLPAGKPQADSLYPSFESFIKMRPN